MKTVSVIIPTYNRENRIERTLVSVLNQDYGNIEIIVIDDGSTDATESVVQRIVKNNADAGKRIRYIRQENHGACVARNRGMMLATGNYIMFLDSDDLLKPINLSEQVKKIETENSQCAICDFECIDDTGNITAYFKNDRHPHGFIRDLVSPSISTVLMRRDSLPPGLQWNSQLKRIQDVDFIYKYFASIETYSYTNEALFQYFLHDGERISDSYKKGVQYGVLRKSFKSYIKDNKAFITTESKQICRAYMRVLWRHQLKNTLVHYIPSSLKKLIKRLLGIKNSQYAIS